MPAARSLIDRPTLLVLANDFVSRLNRLFAALSDFLLLNTLSLHLVGFPRRLFRDGSCGLLWFLSFFRH